jgi:hypothetical protein
MGEGRPKKKTKGTTQKKSKPGEKTTDRLATGGKATDATGFAKPPAGIGRTHCLTRKKK